MLKQKNRLEEKDRKFETQRTRLEKIKVVDHVG